MFLAIIGMAFGAYCVWALVHVINAKSVGIHRRIKSRGWQGNTTDNRSRRGPLWLYWW